MRPTYVRPTKEELNEIYNYLKECYPDAPIDVYFDNTDKTIYTKIYLECEHEYESYGTIDTETDFKGMRDLVGYECIHCNNSFEEWVYRN